MGLTIASKQFYIYLGRLSLTTSTEQVKHFLNNTFNNIKINNLAELNNNKEDRSFKSFKFSVDFLDKSIIDDKTLWPRNSVVTKYKLPYEEWQEIAKKIEEKKKKTSTATSNASLPPITPQVNSNNQN